nr:T cell receptor alpha chain MC.7.G5 isoform X3 [Anas platyrhynchos]
MAGGLGPRLLALALALGPAGTVQGDEIQPTRTTVWGQAGQTETLQCTYSSNASYIYVAWYRQHPNGSLQYLLQSKGRGGSYIHTAPFARKRFSGKADESSGTLFIHALELKDNALYYCTLQGPRFGVGVTAPLIFGKGTQLTVEPSNQKESDPEVVLIKSKALEEGGSTGKAACLARNFYPKNISLDMLTAEVIYEQSPPVMTSEGTYNTIKVVNVAKKSEVSCTAKFKNKNFPANATSSEKVVEEPITANVCNTTDISSKGDIKTEKTNMLSMAVLGLRVLLAKSIAFNTLMSIKLFLF